MADKKFPNGIRAFKPNEKAPSFVKAEIVITNEDLRAWLLLEKGEVKLTLKESQKGTYYLDVNTFESNQPKSDIAKDSDLPF